MFTADDVKGILKDAYELLRSGHHTTGALAKDAHGQPVDVDSEAAVSYCEWGAITAAAIAHGFKKDDNSIVNTVNDLLNKANESMPQYDKYKGRTSPQFVTFTHNDSILTTDEVVQRFERALVKFDDLAEDFVNTPKVKNLKSQHVFVTEDW